MDSDASMGCMLRCQIGMTMVTIYALCDSRVSDPVARVRYIGQTRLGLENRLRRHWVTARAGAREHRAVWMRSVNRDGGEVLIVGLSRVSLDNADAVEVQHIATHRAQGCDLTNRTDGGRGRLASTVSEETRRKMSESAKRRGAHSPEVYQRVSATHKASVTHRAHLRQLHESNRGQKRTEQQRERISQSLRGEKNGQNVIDWHVIPAIRERFAEGVKQAQLAREFGCSPATIHAVVHNVRWVEA